jgi:hypothetical protein
LLSGESGSAEPGIPRASYRDKLRARSSSPLPFDLDGGGTQPPWKKLGKIDDFSYNIALESVHVHDLQAIMLHYLGSSHERLIYRFRGRDYQLTDVQGEVVHSILS